MSQHHSAFKLDGFLQIFDFLCFPSIQFMNQIFQITIFYNFLVYLARLHLKRDVLMLSDCLFSTILSFLIVFFAKSFSYRKGKAFLQSRIVHTPCFLQILSAKPAKHFDLILSSISKELRPYQFLEFIQYSFFVIYQLFLNFRVLFLYFISLKCFIKIELLREYFESI